MTSDGIRTGLSLLNAMTREHVRGLRRAHTQGSTSKKLLHDTILPGILFQHWFADVGHELEHDDDHPKERG